MSVADFQRIEGSGRWAAVAPSNDSDLPGGTTRGLYVGVSGDVVLDSDSDTSVTFTALAAGVIHPLRVRRVRATGTTAENIVAIY